MRIRPFVACTCEITKNKNICPNAHETNCGLRCNRRGRMCITPYWKWQQSNPLSCRQLPSPGLIIYTGGKLLQKQQKSVFKVSRCYWSCIKILCKHAKSLDSLSSAEQDFLLLKNVDRVLEKMKHTGEGPGGDLIQRAFRTTKRRQSGRLDGSSKSQR